VVSASPPSNSAINPGGGHRLSLLLVSLGMIFTNILLTGLTTGRIWWTRRHLRVIGEKKLTQRYNTAIAILWVEALSALILRY
jgi:hypothetical protein